MIIKNCAKFAKNFAKLLYGFFINKNASDALTWPRASLRGKKADKPTLQ